MGSKRVRNNFIYLFNYLFLFCFSDDSVQKFSDYRPVFFDGRAVWVQDLPIEHPPPIPIQSGRSADRTTVIHPFTQFDERQQSVWASTRVCQLNIIYMIYFFNLI
jgi:hypothetical protein